MLETTPVLKERQMLRCQNSIHEELKIRYKLGNACCHSVQNVLSSSLLSKNIKIYEIIILSHSVYGYETWSVTEGEK